MARSAPRPSKLAFESHDLRRARLRLLCGLLAGGATSLLLRRLFEVGWAVEAVAGWDVAAVTFLALTWWIIGRSDAQETRRRAAAEDPGRNAAWALVLLASTFSLFAAVVLLRRAKTLAPKEEALLVILCLVAVISSWVLSHSAYTLRYAHLYYREGEEKEGGLDFPGTIRPMISTSPISPSPWGCASRSPTSRSRAAPSAAPCWATRSWPSCTTQRWWRWR